LTLWTKSIVTFWHWLWSSSCSTTPNRLCVIWWYT
jgi:hypothetical protein